MPAPLSADTVPAAAEVQLAAWRAMTAREKLAQVQALTAAVLRLEREGWRRRHPTLGPDELRAATVGQRLGAELAARVYPSAPRER
ncbi:MAG: hypothetical protein WD771_06585 [Gemmatimonadaceae bacterium]